MKKIKRSLAAVAVFALSTTSATAYDLNFGGTDYGKVELLLKAMHIIDAKNNGYDPSEGTSYLAKLKYVSPNFNGFQFGLASYTNGDLFGATDFTPTPGSERLARGMFVTLDGSNKTLLGEAYINYTGDKFKLNAGRQMLDTPLTKIAYSHMPNFYTAFGASTTVFKGWDLGITQITEMAWGSRAVTDFALIGEGTGTAGVSFTPLAPPLGPLGQAKFHDISNITLGPAAPSTNGITVISGEYTGLKGFKLGIWDYYVDEIANNIYLQGDKTFQIKDKKLAISAQLLHQDDVGAALAGARSFNLFGVKATVKGKGWSVYGAMNSSSGSSSMLNAWGGDPAYTSSIFSRNAYRDGVTAVKVGGSYKIMSNLTLMASHAYYGSSNTVIGGIPGVGAFTFGPQAPLTDAQETDIVLVYKPKKNWMVKLFHANRTSEYDGVVVGGTARDLTQAHTRLVTSIKF